MRKIISLVLALCLAFALGCPAFATDMGSREVPVIVSAEAGRFSVSVPTVLPVEVDILGNVYCANSGIARIVNNSSGPVEVTNVSLDSANGWTLVPFETDYSSVKTSSKQFGFKLQGANVPTTGICDTSGFGIIPGNESIAINYDATVATQSTAITTAETMAYVIFVVGWAQSSTIVTRTQKIMMGAERTLKVDIPSDAMNRITTADIISVESSDESVAEISENEVSIENNIISIRLDPIGSGTTNILVTLADGKEIYITINVIVVDSDDIEDVEDTRVLSSIQIETMPSQTVYVPGDTFNCSGMTVQALYSDGTSECLQPDEYHIINGGSVEEGQSSVTISYSVGGITKTIVVPITVANTFSPYQLSSAQIGDIVKLNVDGVETAFYVIQQGTPTGGSYSNANGTWLLKQTTLENPTTFGTTANYSSSNVHSLLSTWTNKFDADIQAKIKNVTIPLASGTITTKAFALSGKEYGGTIGSTYMSQEGVALDFITSEKKRDILRTTTPAGTTPEAVDVVNSAASSQSNIWLRSNRPNGAYAMAAAASWSGSVSTGNAVGNSTFIRPCIVVDSSLWIVDDAGTVSVSPS